MRWSFYIKCPKCGVKYRRFTKHVCAVKKPIVKPIIVVSPPPEVELPTVPFYKSTTPGPAAGTSYTEQTPISLYDTQDTTYDSLHFVGSSDDWSGLVYMNNYNAGSEISGITFTNCWFGTNSGAGNAVKIVDFGAGGIHDITFDHCHFDAQPRMGFECIGRSVSDGRGGVGYQRVHLTNCTFDAGAGEAISYDDDSGMAGSCIVSGNRVEGAGVGDTYVYGKVIENNGVRNMTWRDNYLGAGRDGIVNISGPANGQPLNMVCAKNVYDATHVATGVVLDNQVFYVVNVNGGLSFADTIINDPTGYSNAWGYINNCSGLDFSASTVTGTSAADNVYGSGNTDILWPTVV